MPCEICGKETNDLSLIEMESNKMLVCNNCKHFGKEVKKDPVPQVFIKKTKHNSPYEKELDAPAIVDGFGKSIRSAREKKGLTIKELGEKIFIKESLMHKIESEKIKPSIKNLKKIEDFLGINLTEEYGEIKLVKKEKQNNMTLEDLLDQKLNKK